MDVALSRKLAGYSHQDARIARANPPATLIHHGDSSPRLRRDGGRKPARPPGDMQAAVLPMVKCVCVFLSTEYYTLSTEYYTQWIGS